MAIYRYSLVFIFALITPGIFAYGETADKSTSYSSASSSSSSAAQAASSSFKSETKESLKEKTPECTASCKDVKCMKSAMCQLVMPHSCDMRGPCCAIPMCIEEPGMYNGPPPYGF